MRRRRVTSFMTARRSDYARSTESRRIKQIPDGSGSVNLTAACGNGGEDGMYRSDEPKAAAGRHDAAQLRGGEDADYHSKASHFDESKFGYECTGSTVRPGTEGVRNIAYDFLRERDVTDASSEIMTEGLSQVSTEKKCIVDIGLEGEHSEDIWNNPVFINMRQRVRNFNRVACEYSWKVIVPRKESLSRVIDANGLVPAWLIKQHIIYSSPYLKDQYMSYSGLQVAIGDQFVAVKLGFDVSNQRPSRCRIISKKVHNCEHGFFDIIYVDKPLLSSDIIDRGPFSMRGQDISSVYSPKRSQSVLSISSTISVPRNFAPRSRIEGKAHSLATEKQPISQLLMTLIQDPRNGPTLRFLEGYVENLKQNYVLVASNVGINHFLEKVRVGVEEGTFLLMDSNDGLLRKILNEGNVWRLKQAVESYLLMGIHDVIFSSLIAFCSEDENHLRWRATKRFRASRRFHKLITKQNSEIFFKDLNRQSCPFGKLEYLQNYMNSSVLGFSDVEIREPQRVVNIFLERIFGMAVAEEKAAYHVIANLQYIRNFCACPVPKPFQALAEQFLSAASDIIGSTVVDISSTSYGKDLLLTRILSHPKGVMVKHAASDSRRNYSQHTHTRPSSVIEVSKSQTLKDSVSVDDSYVYNAGCSFQGQSNEDGTSSSSSTDASCAYLDRSSFDCRRHDRELLREAELGCFLTTLKNCSADVVTSSS